MSLTPLLKTCIVACKDIKPVVLKLYNLIDSTTSTEKADKSIFTVADGLVQHVLTGLFEHCNMQIVGEENVDVNVVKEPFTVGDLTIPSSVTSDINELVKKMEKHSATLSGSNYSDLTVFIDPIDGTREFSTGKGEQSTICTGFARDGKSVAGIVFRPCTEEMSYAAGCADESFFELCPAIGDKPTPPLMQSLLTTNGSISPFMETFLTKAKAERVKTGGAGNKALLLLEGKASLYFQDRGLSRWDTCAAQAVLEANGGCLVKLQSIIDKGTPSPYTYVKSDSNSDPNPSAKFTAYNSTTDSTTNTKTFHPQSNLCGLFALPSKVDQGELEALIKFLQEVAAEVPPAYD